MRQTLRFVFGSFKRDEQGQDLAESCLITALVVLFACAIFLKVSGGMNDLWSTANTTLTTNQQTASAPASSGSSPANTTASTPADH